MSNHLDRARESSTSVGMIERGGAAKSATVGLPHSMRRLALALVAALLLVNTVAGSVMWVTHADVASQRASADLAVRLNHIRAWSTSADQLDTAHLEALQTELDAAQTDFQALTTTIPFGGMLAGGDGQQMMRGVNIGLQEVTAAHDLVAAALLLRPGLHALVASALGARPAPGDVPLTLTTLHQAQRDLALGRIAWQAAEGQEHALVANGRATGGLTSNPTVNTMLAYTASAFQQLSSLLDLSSGIADDLPSLLALDRPQSDVLLLYMDTDQARPVGGTVGAYALVTFKNGSAVGTIHAHDARSLDCAPTCVTRPIPSQYAWFSTTGAFDLRTSELGFNFRDAGAQAVTIYNEESATNYTTGAIAFTPQALQHILSVLGPVKLSNNMGTVNAKNLVSSARAAHSAAPGGTASAPGFDSALLDALSAALAHATPAQLARLGSGFIQDLARGDVQVYSNSTPVEDALTALDRSGSATHSGSDSVFVTNTELDAGFNSPDLATALSDAITLDNKGMAHHTLSVTETYRPTTTAAQSSSFDDVLSVVLPLKAYALSSASGKCATIAVTVTGSKAYACRITLAPSQSVTVKLSWTSPVAGDPDAPGASGAYSLFVQRQPGTSPAVHVTFTSPTGAHLTSSSPDMRVAGATARWSSLALDANTRLSVTFAP